MGFDSSDDAAVYRVREDLAIVQTVDFFPPMVDDPYTFGQIAATNSLSDIYAMGGQPATAMNLICFPTCLPVSVMGEILAGGYDKVREAGAIIAGGHTIEDEEPKYGLCVTGFMHPKDVLTNAGAQVGDALVLTKSLGSGILSTGGKVGMLTDSEYKRMVELMTTLNKNAQQCMIQTGAHACTDVTGFGFLGHAYEMAAGSGKTLVLDSRRVPVESKALELAREGIIPGGAYNNRGYLQDSVEIAPTVPLELSDVLFDPQTAGGLLIAADPAGAGELLAALAPCVPSAQRIGEILPDSDGARILLR